MEQSRPHGSALQVLADTYLCGGPSLFLGVCQHLQNLTNSSPIGVLRLLLLPGLSEICDYSLSAVFPCFLSVSAVVSRAHCWHPPFQLYPDPASSSFVGWGEVCQNPKSAQCSLTKRRSGNIAEPCAYPLPGSVDPIFPDT